MIKKDNRTTPSILEITENVDQSINISFAKKPSIKIAKKLKGISLNAVHFFITNGYIIVQTHKIKKTFEILLQRTFQSTNQLFQLILAIIFTTISGADVQNATIVSQITKSDTQILFASDHAHFIKKSAHFIKMKNQTKNRK